MSSHLEHLLRSVFGDTIIEDPKVTELIVNPDGKIWVERGGDPSMRVLDGKVSETDAIALSHDLAGGNPISAKNPLAGSKFEVAGAEWRAQVVVPPAIEQGVSIALRRAVVEDFSLDELLTDLPELSGSMDDLKDAVDPEDAAVFEAYDTLGLGEFLRKAVKARWNILLSGGTSSGKTTWLRACLGEVDHSERILTIEDVHEIRPRQPNHVSLLASKEASSRDLLKASLRLRPERIIMGELRGAEAYDFLSAINSGHPGGLSTLHATDPEAALDRLAFMVMQADSGLTYTEILSYCRSMIDVVVQFRKIGTQRRPTAVRVFRKNPQSSSIPPTRKEKL